MSLIVVSTAFLVLLGVLGVLFVTRLSALSGRVRTLETREGALERELELARSESSEAEADQQHLSRFVRELPLLVEELHSAAGARHIPRLLLSAVTRSLSPKKALVAVRRRSVEGDAERHMRLAVAAVHPPGWMEVGSEIRIGKGEIGFAAEAQRVMDRKDFENLQPYERRKLREETEPGCMPDVVAPMICKEEVVGVLCVEGARRGAKDTLRLLAQVGAVSVDTQARYVEMSEAEDLLLTVTANGAGKLSSSHDYPVRGRGGQGVAAMDRAMRGGPLVALFAVASDDQVMLATDAGQSIRVPVSDISFRSRSAGGVRVFTTAADEHVVSVALVAENGDAEEE